MANEVRDQFVAASARFTVPATSRGKPPRVNAARDVAGIAYGEYMTNPDSTQAAPTQATITIRPNGPLLVQGDVKVLNSAGEEIERGGRVAFCRCGQSNTKPFCDASHKAVGFEAP